jgi:PTS system cellobiose-specific IIA component
VTEPDERTEIAFQIIAAVGSSRSSYIEAISAAKEGDFAAAEKCSSEARNYFLEGHTAHMNLLTKEASGDETSMNLILTHAEDQLMSAEAFGILSDEFIDVYKRLENCEKFLRDNQKQADQ